jgi:hypothetical protein
VQKLKIVKFGAGSKFLDSQFLGSMVLCFITLVGFKFKVGLVLDFYLGCFSGMVQAQFQVLK